MLRFLILFLFINIINTNPLKNTIDVDWRQKGAILPVPELNSCKHASVINALDAISAANQIKTGKLLQLSAQQIYDCGHHFVKWCPCGYAGNVTDVFALMGQGQLTLELNTEVVYPFTAQCSKICHAQPIEYGNGAHYSGWHGYVQGTNEKQIYTMLEAGPVAAGIEASYEFTEYTDGIFDDSDCSGKHLNHTVLIVGYGTETHNRNKIDYWIARNNWGTLWGEEGYIRIVRDKNMCGIGNKIVQPNVDG